MAQIQWPTIYLLWRHAMSLQSESLQGSLHNFHALLLFQKQSTVRVLISFQSTSCKARILDNLPPTITKLIWDNLTKYWNDSMKVISGCWCTWYLAHAHEFPILNWWSYENCRLQWGHSFLLQLLFCISMLLTYHPKAMALVCMQSICVSPM